MNTNFGVEVEKPNVGNGGSNMSLRNLVDKNQDAMHKMTSKFGDVNKLREQLEQVMVLLGSQRELLAKEVGVLCKKMDDTGESTERKLGALKEMVVISHKVVSRGKEAIVKETEEIEKMKKELCEQMKGFEVAINRRVKRQKYLWASVGILVLSLVCCLGYLCSELKDLAGKMEKMQVNVDTSMTEVKGMALMSTQTKIGQQKDINGGRKNK